VGEVEAVDLAPAVRVEQLRYLRWRHAPIVGGGQDVAVPSPPDLPGWTELAAGLHVVRVPLTVPFRGVTEREAALLQGPVGWGEFAPFVEYGDAAAGRGAGERDRARGAGPGGAGRAGPLPRLHHGEGEGCRDRSGPGRRRGQ